MEIKHDHTTDNRHNKSSNVLLQQFLFLGSRNVFFFFLKIGPILKLHCTNTHIMPANNYHYYKNLFLSLFLFLFILIISITFISW